MGRVPLRGGVVHPEMRGIQVVFDLVEGHPPCDRRKARPGNSTEREMTPLLRWTFGSVPAILRIMCKKVYNFTHIFQKRILPGIRAKRSVFKRRYKTLMSAFGRQIPGGLDS